MKKYMVAVCDILGFTKMVENNSADIIVQNVFGWIHKSLHHSIYKAGFPERVPLLQELQNHSQIGMALFSDTIILYTKEDSEENVRELISTLGWLVFETMLTSARIRCGVAYGEMVIEPENSILVGKPLIEAYNLEKNQAWAGGALTQEAVQRIPEAGRSGNNASWWVVPYAVPLKQKQTRETLAINWTWGIHNLGLDFSFKKSSKEPTESDWRLHPDICEKWFNTKTFHDKVCRWCN